MTSHQNYFWNYWNFGIPQIGQITTSSDFPVCSTNTCSQEEQNLHCIFCCVCYFCLPSLCSQMINFCQVLC